MKYMMLVKLDSESPDGRNYAAGNPPNPKLEAAMGALIGEMSKTDTLVDVGGLLPMAKGARVRASGGKLATTDGPYIESKELLGGYAVLRAKSKAEAIQWGEAFMKLHVDILGPTFAGELEIREMFDPMEAAAGGPR